MSVSIAQVIKAYSAGGIERGHVTVAVTVTNQGGSPILGSASAVHFSLRDAAGAYLTDFRRVDARLLDMTGPIPTGGHFDREIHFDCGSVNIGEQYSLTCIFDQTGDRDTATFNFTPVYLQQGGTPPFEQKK